EAQGRTREIRAAAARRHACQSLRGQVRATDLPADPGLWRIWLSRVAFGELRAAGLCLELAQVLRAGDLHLCAAELAAHGFLLTLAAHPGCTPTRCRSASRRCEG